MLLILAVILLSVLIVMALGAVNIGVVGAWFLHQPFMFGWHQAWHHWPLLLVYVIFLLPLFALRRG